MFKSRINRWLVGFRKYFFTYRDGFFDLPYLSNSPALMVESFKNMPFTKYLAGENEIRTNNIFTEGVMRYCELEDGLWIIMTEIEFKKNVSTNALYDDHPCDYHFLSHFIYDTPVNRVGFNGLTIPTRGWGFYKPGTEIKAFFNKGDKGIFTNFAFSSVWFENHLPIGSFDENHDIRSFLDSDNNYITWEDMVPGSDGIIAELQKLLKDKNYNEKGIIPLKLLCLQTISQFFLSISTVHPVKPLLKLHNNDSRLVARTEKILNDSLTTGFPGIEEIAETLHTSPTKLRTLFKAVHSNTIYQYYQERQMVLALQMLKTGKTSVKNVAITFGYQNSSKFSAAFKKHHQILPSQV